MNKKHFYKEYVYFDDYGSEMVDLEGAVDDSVVTKQQFNDFLFQSESTITNDYGNYCYYWEDVEKFFFGEN